jgi:LacI family transcriptional regulator
MKPIRIGFLGEMSCTYNRRVLHGLALCCQSRRWVLEVWNRPAASSAMALINKWADGFVVGSSPPANDLDGALARPAVALASAREQMSIPRVQTDHAQVGRMVADHLLDQGLRNLAFVGDPFGGWWSVRRQEGFQRRAGELGARCLVFAPYQRRYSNVFNETAALRESRDRACLAWLRRLPRPIGLMGCNDTRAIRVIELCRRLHLRVPEDVAVVGVDDDDLYVQMSDPALSSVSLQTDRMGYAAGELLGRLLAGQRPPRQPVVVPPAGLIVRRSSDTVAIADPVVAGALRFIRQHLPDQAGVKQLMAEVAVSRSTLDARFREALGRSAAEEVRRTRIAQAKYLLSATDLPMPQLARRAGFSSARQLDKTFHHEMGITPTAYRRQFLVR